MDREEPAVDYPRVLHLGFQPIGSPTNAGITLDTMFGDWPADRLLQVCLRDHPKLPRPATVVVAPASIAPLDGLARRILGRRVPTGAIDGLNNSVKRTGRLSAKTRLRLVANAVNDVGPVHLPRELVTQVEAFKPQVIHSLLGGVRAMRIALAFSKRLDVPIVPHFMDDWPENLFIQGQLGGFARWTSMRDLDRVMERSPVCLSIGSDMEREFEARYRRPCPVVGNSVDVDQYQHLRSTRTPADGLCLRYVGGLHLHRDQIIRQVAAALAGGPWTLELFVPPSDGPLAEEISREYDNVRHRGSRSPDEVPDELVSASALLFLESNQPEVAQFTRLSVSTKVPQYLAAGRPVLVIGPEDQGSVRTLRRSPLAEYVADPADRTSLLTAMTRLAEMRSRQPGDEEWVRTEFGTAATRERLQETLRSAACRRS